jgi:chromosome segregation protein
LLKLKRVEIHGFKSFYDRTEMKFNGSGIAAVVGPNGCGKSNLSDAISWVLGEQSAKSLRGARMEDVIFAGTRDKKALGMASVTMTLVPDERKLGLLGTTIPVAPDVEVPVVQLGEAPAELVEAADGPAATTASVPPVTDVQKAAERSGEVTITRRLYRSGESEYLINSKTARLRDIQDLFLGTGLGPESYAIIEQGRIGQILSNKPQDRRGVIEEAAGITKFKTRKRLAEAKLESAKQNLSRVFDILEEVSRQANSLKRQAAKTKRYSELKAEATGYLRRVLAAKFQQLERETAKVAIELNMASAHLQTAQTSIGERETEQTGVLESSYATEQELTTARKLLADLNLEAERARGRLEYQIKQIQQIDGRLNASDGETRALALQQREREVELEKQTAAWQALEAEFEGARAQLGLKAEERQQAQSRLAEQERGLEASRQRVLRLLGDSAGLKNRITQVEAQLAAADRDTARARADEQQSDSDLRRIQQVRTQLSERLSSRQTELVSITDQRKEVEQELQAQRAELQESRQVIDRLRGDHSRAKARKDSLEEVIQHRSYTTETVKRLFTAAEKGTIGGFKPLGVLADFLEVDPQFEKAAEEFLHDELEFVVVRHWEDAERGVELMRGELSGRATFLAEHIEAEVDLPHDLPQPQAEAGALTKLTDALRFSNGLTELPKHLLPRIANCYVATERMLARQLAPQYPHCWFLSADGVSYHGRAVSGGKKTGAGPLGLKRELREISQVERLKHAEMTSAQTQATELERAIAGLTEHLEYLRGQQQAQEKDVLALDHESRKLAEELQRIQQRLSHARLELDRIARDSVKLQENVARDQAQLEQHEQARSEQEQALEAARDQLGSLQDALARAAEEHSGLRANLASLEERRRSIGADRARLEHQLAEFANRQANLLREAQRLTGEKTQFLASNEELQVKSQGLTGSLAGTAAEVERLAAQEAGLRERLTATEDTLKGLRAAAQIGLEKRSALQVALARAESDLKHLEETCQKELEIALDQLVAGTETLADESELQDLDSKYIDARRKIEALGPVNPQALEEFEEAQQRQDFLQAQRQDLLDSIRDTEKAIHEIDGESRKRFGEAFHAINANFRVMFQVLFGGGTGEMRLTDEENLSESGIDIVASPPGKKLQSVLLLSGGEKSLTAMALLMGIFQYTPSPFCILDEVDAPLDEPNIERLTRLLKEMAEHTQFIVITHAKRTMEAAQSLYGVTMQEPGVSRLVSVRFKPPAEAPRVSRTEAMRPKQIVEQQKDEALEPALA